MINLEEKVVQEKNFNSIIIYSHRLNGAKRAEYITEVGRHNPHLAARCIMSCEGDKEVEEKVAQLAENHAREYENIERASNGYLALIELNNLDAFKNVVIELNHSSLRYLTLVLKRIVSNIDASQIISIIKSIINIPNAAKGIKPKLLLDIMKFIIMSNIFFDKNQINEINSLYKNINDTLRLSQIALFLKCSKSDVLDFLNARGLQLKSGENPKLKYMYLSYFIGQTSIVNKANISFGENLHGMNTKITIPKDLLEMVINKIKQDLIAGEVYKIDIIINIINYGIENYPSQKVNSVLKAIKQLKIIVFEKLEINANGINYPYYKLLYLPDINQITFESNSAINKSSEYQDASLNKKDKVKPNSLQAIVMPKQTRRAHTPYRSNSELGEKLVAALKNKKPKKN